VSREKEMGDVLLLLKRQEDIEAKIPSPQILISMSFTYRNTVTLKNHHCCCSCIGQRTGRTDGADDDDVPVTMSDRAMKKKWGKKRE
jgi:hypothetical protein